MRWTILALVVAIALILDAMKFNGYYRDLAVRPIVNGVTFVSNLVRR